MNPHSWQARAKRRDLRVNADIAAAEASDIIRLAAKIETIAKHIKAEGYCATAVVLADEASEIQRRARKSLDAAAELCKVLEDHQK